MKKDLSANTGHQNLEEVHEISFSFATSSSRRNIKMGVHRLASKNFQSYLQQESLCKWVIQRGGLQERKPQVYLSPFYPSGAFKSNSWATWKTHCPSSASHLPGQRRLPSVLTISAHSHWGCLKDGMASCPGILVYLGVRSAPHFSSTAMECIWPEKESQYLSLLETTHRTLNRELLWLTSKMTVEMFKKAFSKGLECFFLIFFIACVVFFWLSNSWMHFWRHSLSK